MEKTIMASCCQISDKMKLEVELEAFIFEVKYIDPVTVIFRAVTHSVTPNDWQC